MAGSLLDRCFSVLEALSREPAGLGLQAVSREIGTPVGSAHRLLIDLVDLGYVRQDDLTQRYLPSLKLVTMAFRHLSASGVVDAAQPILNRLAQESGELVRLAIAEGDTLVWVAKAQGARVGLRYDPEMGVAPTLFCTATGHAWLAAMDGDKGIELAARQGFGRLTEHGPNAPRTVKDLMARIVKARAAGVATVMDSGAAGTSALAAVIRHPGTSVPVGTVSIAGPSMRLTAARLKALAPVLLAAADDLAAGSVASPALLRSDLPNEETRERTVG